MRATRSAVAAALTVSVVLSVASCTGGDVAGVDLAPSATVSSTPQPASTINEAAVAALRTAAALDPCPDSAPAGASAASSDGLPAVTLACLGDGPDVALGALRGPYVVNLWASWCGECTDEAPYLAEVYSDPSRTVDFLGLDYNDPAARGLEKADELGMRYPSVWSDDNSLRAPLRIPGLPITLFIDSTGREVGRKTGPITSTEELRSLIHQYLGVTE